jgi:hypothetical protein
MKGKRGIPVGAIPFSISTSFAVLSGFSSLLLKGHSISPIAMYYICTIVSNQPLHAVGFQFWLTMYV